MFEHFSVCPADPILSLVPRFQDDPRPEKVNLGIGVYVDAAGRLPVLAAVKAAAEILQHESSPYGYLPMAGDAGYRRAVQALLFGPTNSRVVSGCISTIQTLGGTGALKVGADVLRRHFPGSAVWVSDPGWDNHKSIFEGAGFEVHRYPYFDASRGVVDHEGMVACLRDLPPRSFVLIHAGCHNPTGADLTREQWTRIAEVVRVRALIPFFDLAYQGFAEGLDADCHAIRCMADAGIPLLVANSFSKNLSLYGERCGALSIVCKDRDEAARALSQMEAVVRRSYSSPPSHGGRIIATILADDALTGVWEAELNRMRERLGSMRSALFEALRYRLPDHEFDYLANGKGMFTTTGLSSSKVDALRNQHAIYLAPSGRLCLAGLAGENVVRVADALAMVMSSPGRAMHECL